MVHFFQFKDPSIFRIAFTDAGILEPTQLLLGEGGVHPKLVTSWSQGHAITLTAI